MDQNSAKDLWRYQILTLAQKSQNHEARASSQESQSKSKADI